MAKKKKNDKVTEAGSVELEENELDNVTGGAGDFYLKLDGVDGESLNEAQKIGTQTELGIKGKFNEGKHIDGLKSR